MPTPLRAVLWPSLLFLLAGPALGDEEAATEPEKKPLWELGFGAGSLHVADYPASSESRLRSIALPYIIYRGDILRIGDGQSARAVAAETNRFELSMSFDAAFDARSDRNRVRDGMVDLDFLFEAGPQLIYTIGDYDFADGGRSDLQLSMQARGVFSTDFKRIDHRGYILEPMLRYRHYGLIRPQFDLTISLRPVWADRDLHSYFYGVAPVDETGSRPPYEAREGYFGTHLNFYGTWHMSEKFQLFGGIQTLNQYGSVNRDSPLYEEDFTIGLGLGFIWSVFESSRQVVPPR